MLVEGVWSCVLFSVAAVHQCLLCKSARPDLCEVSVMNFKKKLVQGVHWQL